MVKLGEPTLDQQRIFLAIVDEGSFGAAARRLGRAISAISYGVTQMEAQLGLTLFEREGSRRPVITEAGRGLLPEVRAVVASADAMLAKAADFHAGLESDVAMVVDVMFPGVVTAEVLREFRTQYPTVALRLEVEAIGAVIAPLLAREAQLAIGGPACTEHEDLVHEVIGEVELVLVAAPDHPLALTPVAPGEARQHLQLVLSDRSSLSEGLEFGVLSPLTWRLADLSAKHALLKEGIGWGSLPRHMVSDDLAAGRLVELDLPERPGGPYRVSAIWRRDSRPGPATRWLVEALRARLAGCSVSEPSVRSLG